MRHPPTLLIVLVAFAAVGAPAKKKKAPDTSADAAIKKLLDAEQQHIADCVLAEAPPGAWSVTVKAKLAVNGGGQVMSCAVSFEPARSDAVKACVQKTLEAVAWPKSSAPLTSISREWSFAMK